MEFVSSLAEIKSAIASRGKVVIMFQRDRHSPSSLVSFYERRTGNYTHTTFFRVSVLDSPDIGAEFRIHLTDRLAYYPAFQAYYMGVRKGDTFVPQFQEQLDAWLRDFDW